MERRTFLKTAAASAALATPAAQAAEDPSGNQVAEKKTAKVPTGDIVITRPGSDFMVDVL